MTDANGSGDDRADEAAQRPPTGEAEPDSSAEGGSVFGPRPDEGATELVPGTPDPENTLFVVLGIATTLALVAALLGLI